MIIFMMQECDVVDCIVTDNDYYSTMHSLLQMRPVRWMQAA